jgi:hypothetical protein
MATHPLPWLKKFFEDNFKILMAKTMTTGTIKRGKKALKLWNLETLLICLEYPFTASPEARHQ